MRLLTLDICNDQFKDEWLATGVIKLVEQGVLDLNAPVSDYISSLALDDAHGAAVRRNGSGCVARSRGRG